MYCHVDNNCKKNLSKKEKFRRKNLDAFVENSDDLLTRFKSEIGSVDSDVSIESVESLNEIFNNFGEMSTSNSEDISDEENQEPLNVTSKINIILDCSKESGAFLNQYADILSRQTANFIFVVQNGNESE